ncbi:MAG: FAD-dependent oxidoreductase, partial [Planctomycetes bacterium]|nr:FAD-dependent oxidoreductase [Planctomycetota bacterium]
REDTGLRPQFVPKAPPCATTCPNETDVRALLGALARPDTASGTAERAFQEAFRILVDRNPLPATCAALCPHRCEESCHRAGYDEAVAVNAIEQFVGEYAIERGFPLTRLSDGARADRMAIVGAGAAGLSAAYQLARRGYPVTIFDPFPRPGGELRYSALAERLTPGVLDAEIDRILSLGVEVRPGTRVGEDVTLEDLSRSFARTLSTRVYEAGRPVEPASIVPSIHLGRKQAALAEASLSGIVPAPAMRLPPSGRDRIRFDYYPHEPRMTAGHGATGAAAGAPHAPGRPALTAAQVIAEAKRCLSCGDCFACDNCWKYCPDQAVIKPLDAGQPYRFRLDFCQGCAKCAEECPSGYIEMR